MTRALLPLFIAATLCAAANASSWETSSFRAPDGNLIQHGTTKTEVTASAGEPVSREVVASGIATPLGAGQTREVWAYQGADGTYLITFRGNEVESIRVIPNR